MMGIPAPEMEEDPSQSEEKLLLSLEVGSIISEAGVNPILESIALEGCIHAGAVTEIKEVNMMKLQQYLAKHGMVIDEQRKFLKELHKRKNQVKN